MARSSSEALEALIGAANEYAAANAACDAAAVAAGKKASPAVHNAAMDTLRAACIHVNATASYMLYAAAMYEASIGGKRND